MCFGTTPRIILVTIITLLSSHAEKAQAEYVLDAGEWNSVDTTTAIQTALNSSESIIRFTAVAVPNGETWITGPLRVPSNKTIYIEAGVRIKGKIGAFVTGDDAIFIMRRTTSSSPRPSNISIIGTNYLSKARIEFDPNDPNIYNDERRHAFAITNSDNILIDNIQITYTYGDGIFIGDDNQAFEPKANRNSTYVTVRNSIIDRASRNGISINAGKHILIQNCAIRNTFSIKPGIASNGPWAGVDIEPDQSEHPLTDIQINDCDFFDNKTHGILMELANAAADQDNYNISISVDRARVDGSGISGHWITNALPHLKGSILVKNGYVKNTNSAGIVVRDKAKVGPAVEFRDLTIDNVNLTNPGQPNDVAPIVVYKQTVSPPSSLNFTDGEIYLNHLIVANNAQRAYVLRAAGRSGYLMNHVWGSIDLQNSSNNLISTNFVTNINVTVY